VCATLTTKGGLGPCPGGAEKTAKEEKTVLSREENELLVHVGPQAPMGRFLRQYWIPVMPSSDVPNPDGPPLRLRVLAEDLVVFRDSSGAVGLLDEYCPHRGASLYYGRNEAGGLRCLYHGWKFGRDGRCLEMPNEPNGSRFASKIRQRAYPCREAGGVIWAYLGPAESPPPLPAFEWLMLPEGQRWTSLTLRACNWLQGLEGDIDSSHFFFLHSRLHPEDSPTWGAWHADRHPRLEIRATACGAVYGAGRTERDGQVYWRVTQYLYPFYALFQPGRVDGTILGHIWVPVDDYETWVWTVAWHPLRALKWEVAPGEVDEYLPPTPEGNGRWRPRANRANDYRQDRLIQRTHSFSGIPTVTLQDQAMTESMGPIVDRRREHLGAADAMIIYVRRRLLKALRTFLDEGKTAPGADRPAGYRVRSAAATLPAGVSWHRALEGWLRAESTQVPTV